MLDGVSKFLSFCGVNFAQKYKRKFPIPAHLQSTVQFMHHIHLCAHRTFKPIFHPQISIFAQEDVLQFFLEFAVENFSLPTFYFWLEINDSGTIFPFGGNSNAI
jgi:hypothetical protein